MWNKILKKKEVSLTIVGNHRDEYFCTISFFSFEVALEKLSFNVKIASIINCYFSSFFTNLNKHIIWHWKCPDNQLSSFNLLYQPEQAYHRRSGQPHLAYCARPRQINWGHGEVVLWWPMDGKVKPSLISSLSNSKGESNVKMISIIEI